MLIYRYAFQNSLGGNYGEATALSVMLALVLAVLSFVYFKSHRALEPVMTTCDDELQPDRGILSGFDRRKPSA